MKKFTLPPVTSYQAAKYFTLLLSFVLLNFALPQREPLAFPLFFSAIFCGFSPIPTSVCYLLSSIVPLSGAAFFSAVLQATFLCFTSLLYIKKKKKAKWEKYLYALLLQLPFALLFPFSPYALPINGIWQIALFCLLNFTLCILFEGGLSALLYRLFQCKLLPAQFLELTVLWLCVGLGVCNALSVPVFYALSLSVLLFSVVLLKSASTIALSIALCLPLCLAQKTLSPVAEYAFLCSAALLVSPYGKIGSALCYFLAFAGCQFLSGAFALPTQELVFLLLSGAIPAVLVCLCPDKTASALKSALLFYREKALPRIAINRNRRAVGERLYEISSLFREIEGAFEENDLQPDANTYLCDQLKDTFCADCPERKKCERADTYSQIKKLVAVGSAKGQVSLIDLSAELSARCKNAAGLLFACNKLLAGYRNTVRELQSAKESRKLLAEQARGVSEILKEIALEQSEEYCFSEGESALVDALNNAGILSSEIFVYGEGNSLTVNLTLLPEINGKKLCQITGNALGVPLTLAEKIPLSPTRCCYILKRKPEYDAAFGVAFCKKEGEEASGDTYSVLKIDERRFLLALSDGMGSGQKARNVSDKTLSLLESFYKAKMPSDTVLNTVNRLISYSSEETFSCLDLAAVDLDTGDTDIVKIGSPAGFILSEEELRVLEEQSLPLGMLDCVHPATFRAKMGEGDFILFMSDGVTSAFGSSSELYGYLSELRPINPQSLAEDVLKRALAQTDGKAEDDMTVLAVKLMKTA